MGNIYDLNPEEMEEEILQFWQSKNINEELSEARKGGRNYYLVRPPFQIKDEFSWDDLFENIIYDVWARFKGMHGFNVRNGIGFDPLSLRIEKLALKEKGRKCLKTSIDSEDEIFESMSEMAEEFEKDTEEHLQQLGIWTKSEFDYKTIYGKFIDSVWWSISELMEKDLLTKKEKPVKWCPDCKIPVTSTEISTREEQKNSAIIKIPLASGKERYFLVEINEIWKIPSSLSLLVDKESNYSIVKSTSEDKKIEQFVVQREKVEEIMEKSGRKSYEILKTVKGEQLEGLSYRYPLGKKIPEKREVECDNKRKVITSESVEVNGSGIEFFTPAYDEKHWELAEEKDMNIYDPIKENGYFDKGPRKNKYSGLSALQNEDVILDDLKSEELLFWEDREKRKIEICDACRSKMTKHIHKEWFLEGEEIKEHMEEDLNDKVQTFPSDEELKLNDWIITRDNNWGVSFPFWICECGESLIPSDREALSEKSNFDLEDDNMEDKIEVAVTPNVLNDIEVNCPECGKEMDREHKVISPLFLQAVSPWAQMGYPQEEDGYHSWWPGKVLIGEKPEKNSLISANLALSLSLFEETSVEKILFRGTVISGIDYKNVKGLVDNQGHDTLRLHLLSDSNLCDNRRIEGEQLQEPHPMIRVLWNLYKFFEDQIEDTEIKPKELDSEIELEKLEIEDMWLLSKLETTKKTLVEHYENGRIDNTEEELEEFILDDFAQWYFSLAKARINEDKENISTILKVFYRSLNIVSKLIFPSAPYIGEKIYQDMNEEENSIFTCNWPEMDERYRDIGLEKEMDEIENIVCKIMKSKRRSDLPEKWPLDQIIVKLRDEEDKELIERFGHVIKDKAKVKEIKTIGVDEEWDQGILKVRPNEDAIGDSYQHWKSKIATMLEQKSPEKIREGVEKGEFTMGLEGQIIEIEPEMVEFEKDMPEGFVELSIEDYDIFVNLEVTNEIWEKEMVREIILRLKSMREDLNLAEKDEMDAYISSDEHLNNIVEENKTTIKEESGAREIIVEDKEEMAEKSEYILEWSVNGQDIEIGVKPLYKTKVMAYFTELSGVDEEIAESLYEARYTSIEKLKEASASELSDIDGVKRSLARSIINSMKEVKSEEDLKEVKTGTAGRGKMSFESQQPEEKTREERKEETKPSSKEEEKKEISKTEEKTEIEEKDQGVETMDQEDIQKQLPDEISIGSTYLIEEKGAKGSYKLFKEILERVENGLCVSRDYPDKVKKKHDLQDIEIIWLSNVDREDVIRPKSLEKLSLALENFLARKGGVILLNGIEYLITNNDFRTVLHLIQSIKDQVAINESILLIPVNPKVIEENQLDLLDGEVDNLLEP